ncbi:MAG: ABC transporter ATP-binding protein [Desulfovibrio sp.]|nr:MAG: ABC transporter ATP-binding protein [Desulfovibrio sp.]
MLNVKNINVSYGDIQVLWDVSFHVEENEFVVLVGSNGAGKSTTLKALSHLVDLSSGSVEFAGNRLDKTNAHQIVELGIAHVPEARQLFPEMSVEENLVMGSLKRGKDKRAKNMEWVYELFPRLKERRKQHAGTLSGGEQQMCAIGRGLMSDPKLMMFDEPSLGLSPLLTQEIFRLVEKIHDEGMTILMVEQNVKQTLGICDRAYVLENGRIELEGKGKDLLEDDRVKQAFLGI